ncbi:hypothetical protein ACVWXN_000559 [Bradyrhizobium sp. i1.4.4]
MTYIAKPKFHHPGLKKNELGYTHRDYEGKISTLCAGCGHDSITASIIEACYELSIEPHRVAKISGIGCSSKTPDYFSGQFARLQLRARPHAVGLDRRQPRQPRSDLSRRLRRRRFRLDRLRPVRSFDPARRQHDLYRREQRRLRPDQGPVLGHRRPRLEVQEGRHQHRQRDRPRRDRAAARGHLRRALVLRRQEPAGAADRGRDRPQGRILHRRHQPLHRLQQPRRLDQELRLCAGAQ